MFKLRIYAVTTTGDTPFIQFNGDTSNNYEFERLSVAGTSVTSAHDGSHPGIKIAAASGTNDDVASLTVTFSKTLSTRHLSLIAISDTFEGGNNLLYGYAGTWTNTSSKVTSVKVSAENDTTDHFQTGSSWVLEGVKL